MLLLAIALAASSCAAKEKATIWVKAIVPEKHLVVAVPYPAPLLGFELTSGTMPDMKNPVLKNCEVQVKLRDVIESDKTQESQAIIYLVCEERVLKLEGIFFTQ